MSWQQQLVNSQVSVNSAVFEMSRDGYPKGDRLRKETEDIDLEYISFQISEAIQELFIALKELKEVQTGQKTLF